MRTRHSLGSIVRLTLDIVSGGSGVISQSPTIAIQRRSDLKWFSPTDGLWYTNIVETVMTQTDSVYLPGRYHFDFDQELDLEVGSTEYSAVKRNLGGSAALEYEDLVFGPLAASSSPTLCSVQGTIYSSQAEPKDNVLVRAVLVPLFRDGLGRAVQSDAAVSTYTDRQGGFDLPLVRGGVFRLEIRDIGYDKKVIIPDQATVLFTEL